MCYDISSLYFWKTGVVNKNYYKVPKCMDACHVQEEMYTEIVLFMDIAYPEWEENVEVEEFVGYIINENNFIYSKDDYAFVLKLLLLYKSIAHSYESILKYRLNREPVKKKGSF